MRGGMTREMVYNFLGRVGRHWFTVRTNSFDLWYRGRNAVRASVEAASNWVWLVLSAYVFPRLDDLSLRSGERGFRFGRPAADVTTWERPTRSRRVMREIPFIIAASFTFLKVIGV